MAMTASEFYAQCLEQATDVMKHVAADLFGKPTPDTEWDVHALANHMLYELAWLPEILAGKTVAEVGNKYDGDLVGDGSMVPLAERWAQAADVARSSIGQANPTATVHLSYGDTTVEDYLTEAGGDELIHAWDLGKAIGQEVVLKPELAQPLYERVRPRAAELAASGLFKPPLTVPEDAALQTKLLALYGRDANWQAPA